VRGGGVQKSLFHVDEEEVNDVIAV
jgi:hypothetical protein